MSFYKIILVKLFFISFLLVIITATSFAQIKTPYNYKIPVQFKNGLKTASLTEVGIDSTIIIELTDSIRSGYFPNIHSLLIVRNNKLVYEEYWPGKDEIWGEDIGLKIHGRDSLHDIRSISKSVVSACIGIAIAKGKIKGVDEKVFKYFPEYASFNQGDKSNITIKHLLTMSSGLEWNERLPYTDTANTEIKMDNSPDPIRYLLSQPLAVKPGAVWNYNGGGTEVLAAIIKRATGQDVAQFAKENLFEPLGIKTFYWSRFPANEKWPSMPAGASGLQLRSRDLVKFGLLYSNEGRWKNLQILRTDWVKESFSSQINRGNPNSDYGYQFWVQAGKLNDNPLIIVGAVGNGDQQIYFDKTHNLVIVTTAGNYNRGDIKNNSWAFVWDYILPALTKK